ncbi:Pentatricopeptide repeat-containing protein mitochondrial [Spatholobus suberectus]|nr:Pentatricopeptide repeat-containing protein mitochondrial [Spatholobus suberectus]
MGEARRLFSAMPEKNCVSWSAMVSGYVACGDLDSAVECFYAAPVRSVITWTAMITGQNNAIELKGMLFYSKSNGGMVFTLKLI